MTPDCAPGNPKGTGNRVQGTGEPGADAVFLPRLRSPNATRFAETVVEWSVDSSDHSVAGINTFLALLVLCLELGSFLHGPVDVIL